MDSTILDAYQEFVQRKKRPQLDSGTQDASIRHNRFPFTPVRLNAVRFNAVRFNAGSVNPVRFNPFCSFQPRGIRVSGRWYQEGLQFECTQCGRCCSGEPGYVWVDDDEIDRMANARSLSVEEFEDRFVRRVGARKSLREYPDGDCILLDPEQRTCLVYEQRPTQCRTWPFWDSNVKSPTAWEETCRECPGAGHGRLYSFDEIEIERKKKKV